MPCGCGGSNQQASQRRALGDRRGTRSAEIDTRPTSVADPSLYWNGPKRTVEPTFQHTRRTD